MVQSRKCVPHCHIPLKHTYAHTSACLCMHTPSYSVQYNTWKLCEGFLDMVVMADGHNNQLNQPHTPNRHIYSYTHYTQCLHLQSNSHAANTYNIVYYIYLPHLFEQFRFLLLFPIPIFTLVQSTATTLHLLLYDCSRLSAHTHTHKHIDNARMSDVRMCVSICIRIRAL